MFQTAYLPFTAPCSCLSCYCCSVTKSCLAPCNPIDCSTPGSISSSNEYSGLISFRMDWLDLLAVQETLKSLLHHNSKASILQCSAFFMGQFSHLYMTAGKTINFPSGSDSKASAYIAGNLGSIPGSGRPPGEGNGSSLQHSCLKKSVDRGAWRATVCGVAKSRTWLINFYFHFSGKARSLLLHLPSLWCQLPH